ncbi:electron transport complex protein RnfC [Hypnocyclicus thermotrophus]|uniref:Electron transport complex protein RnfC n=1 Tax=Hypnocyclicus thermotrophus TaxID=1627895 RepID=A0AA46I5P9_9FUSO|nr:RnfABCDGE type electron transport complex subunit C [Hypnocyclicus thermotrophus]TDT69180.1 electron transport complex protein RnfC [Hypnocyclicus thermotrophus]
MKNFLELHYWKKEKDEIEIEHFFDVEEVLIPLDFKEKYTIYKQKNDYIHMGEVVAKDINNFPIFSSVAGTFIEIIEKNYKKDKKIKYIKIKVDIKNKKNNFKKRKNYENLTKKEFLKILKDYGIIDFNKKNTPVYKKFMKLKDDKIKHFIINGLETEPYLNGNNIVIYEKIKELKIIINFIIKLFKLENIIIIIENNKELSNFFKIHFDKSVIIKRVPKLYPLHKENLLIKYLFKKKYSRDLTKHKILMLNILCVLDIYNAVVENKPVIEKIVSVNGKGIEKPSILLVPIGMKIKDILEYCFYYNNKCKQIVINSLMDGEAIYNIELPVLRETKAIIALDEKETEKIKSYKCINCGRCVEVCPMNLVPLKFLDLSVKDVESIKKYNFDKCISCGSCQYICPTNQPLRETIYYLKKKLEEIDE